MFRKYYNRNVTNLTFYQLMQQFDIFAAPAPNASPFECRTTAPLTENLPNHPSMSQDTAWLKVRCPMSYTA